jgi:hypothetical protein
MSLISPAPNQNSVTQSNGIIDPAWKAFFTDVYNGIFATQQSGITSNRPVKLLFIGRFYFDTTLGLPIWYNGTNWIKADGTVV